MGTVQKYYTGFFLFYFSLLGLFIISVYQLISDRRHFIICLRSARRSKSRRLNLNIVSFGTYIIAALTLIGYVSLNALFAYGHFREEIDLLPRSFEFASTAASGMLCLVLLICLTILLAFFVRRSQRWAGVIVPAFALFHSFIGAVILIALSSGISLLEDILDVVGGFLFSDYWEEEIYLIIPAATLINPVFYFFIYCCITLIFIEKIWKKQKPRLEPPEGQIPDQ